MKLSVSNLVVAIFEQLSRRGALRNIFVTHNAFGIFSRYSHIARRTGKPKVAYPSKVTAQKAAESMCRKHGVHFSTYKCAWCDGRHIGKTLKINCCRHRKAVPSLKPLFANVDVVKPIR